MKNVRQRGARLLLTRERPNGIRSRWLLVGRNGNRVRVSEQRAELLLMFAGRKFVSYDDLSEFFWPDPDAMPDMWMDNIRVKLHFLRHNILNPVGLRLRSAYNAGYYIDEAI